MLRANRALEKIEIQKKLMLEGVAGWTELRLRFKPSPVQWSTVEVLHHLAKVEMGIVEELKRGVKAPVEEIPVAMKLRGWIVIGVMLSRIKVKTPAEVAALISPDSTTTLAEAEMIWNEAQSQLRELLQSLTTMPRGGVFRHPVGGWMPLGKTLLFLHAHAKHHEAQLRRLRRESAGR